jgi:hypothetical protein
VRGDWTGTNGELPAMTRLACGRMFFAAAWLYHTDAAVKQATLFCRACVGYRPPGILPLRRQDLPSFRDTAIPVCPCSATPASRYVPDQLATLGISGSTASLGPPGPRCPCNLPNQIRFVAVFNLDRCDAPGMAAGFGGSGLPSWLTRSHPSFAKIAKSFAEIPLGAPRERVSTRGPGSRMKS